MVIGLIPARGESKGVAKKNIRHLAGFPLIAYPIAASIMSNNVQRTIVSTDSEEIADLARRFGAEVPFMRPAEFAGDASPDMEFVRHALDWFKDNEGSYPELLVHLRPTTPLRDPSTIDRAVKHIRDSEGATSLRSVHEMPESPYKLFNINDGFLEGMYPDDPRPEYYNLPRQAFPPVYNPNGYVDILKSSTVLESGSLHGKRMLSFITPDAGEVDREEDLLFVEFRLKAYGCEIYEYLKKNY